MGTQFWWFFDIAAAAVLFTMIYIGAKKGFVKTIIVFIGLVVSVILGTSVSGSIAEFIYDSAVKSGDIRNIEEGLQKNDVIQKIESYIEGLGYNVKINTERLTKILGEGGDVRDDLYTYVNNINGKKVDTKENFSQKMDEGFAEIMGGIISEKVSAHAGVVTAEQIRNNPKEFGDTLRIIVMHQNDETDIYRAAAKHIESTYTKAASVEMITLFAEVVFIILVAFIMLMIIRRFNGEKVTDISRGISDYVLGGIAGIALSIAIIVILTIAVRLLVMLGNDDMLLFNSETIKRTYVFKYIYDLLISL